MKTSSLAIPDHIASKLDLLFNELKEIGIDYVGHGVINEKGEHTGYFSHKDWGEHYLEKGYFYDDPVLEVFYESPLKILDWVMVENRIKSKEILYNRTQHTGIIQGVTAVTKVYNHLEFLNLGFVKKVDVNQYLLENHLMLKSYMQVFRHYHTYHRISTH